MAPPRFGWFRFAAGAFVVFAGFMISAFSFFSRSNSTTHRSSERLLSVSAFTCDRAIQRLRPPRNRKAVTIREPRGLNVPGKISVDSLEGETHRTPIQHFGEHCRWEEALAGVRR